MTTTADVIAAPRNRQPVEFPVICGHCNGPLRLLAGRAVPVYVHARHAAWTAAPHTAFPVTGHGQQPGAWELMGLLDADPL